MASHDAYHNPVMLIESISGLVHTKDGIYVDATFGGGGHSREVLSNLSENGRLIAFDHDEDALFNSFEDGRFQLIQSNFKYLQNSLRFLGITQIDGVLADLGVSSHQFDSIKRGFSIRGDAKLDMRMDKTLKSSAYNVVNTYSEEQLAEIFWQYGELRESRKLAYRIVHQRSTSAISSTGELIGFIESLSPPQKRNAFFARVFQALRIEVNQEMNALEQLLLQSAQVLKPGGRLVVISYHSLEDRMVKRFMQSGNITGEVKKDFYGNPLKPFTQEKKMPLTPGIEEIEKNNRARSAKLRIATKNEEQKSK